MNNTCDTCKFRDKVTYFCPEFSLKVTPGETACERWQLDFLYNPATLKYQIECLEAFIQGLTGCKIEELRDNPYQHGLEYREKLIEKIIEKQNEIYHIDCEN
jgi:hypothetical protein